MDRSFRCTGHGNILVTFVWLVWNFILILGMLGFLVTFRRSLRNLSLVTSSIQTLLPWTLEIIFFIHFGIISQNGSQEFYFIFILVYLSIIGCLVGWLVWCLVAFLVRWLFGWLVSWLIELLAVCLVGWLVGCFGFWLLS